MIEETATVVSEEDGFVWVETQRQSTCGSCAANKGCGTATLSKVLGQRRTRVRALNGVGAHAGERVVIGLQESALVRGSLMVYTMPLLFMLASAVLGQVLGHSSGFDAETLATLFGLAGLLFGFAQVRRFGRRIGADPRYQPVVLRRLDTLVAIPNRAFSH